MSEALRSLVYLDEGVRVTQDGFVLPFIGVANARVPHVAFRRDGSSVPAHDRVPAVLLFQPERPSLPGIDWKVGQTLDGDAAAAVARTKSGRLISPARRRTRRWSIELVPLEQSKRTSEPGIWLEREWKKNLPLIYCATHLTRRLGCYVGGNGVSCSFLSTTLVSAAPLKHQASTVRRS